MHDEIAVYLREQPFQPFRVSLTDGSVHDVLHPDLAEVSESVLRLYRIDHETRPPTRTWYVIIALEHVVSLEDLIPDGPVVVDPQVRNS